ncbi:molybdopterin-guanine dinucleotide biosynthesis protein B [Desulfococcus sp.]|uniref:molybdopterin-guanine dinucleotide biosynthesis protein B n=1 Tax=Desulfococcus sp. TaxID=2025834 RepID=UPI003593EBED
MKPPVISIVSKKRSGKTTLLEKLIPELKRRGYRVGTVKHDTHGFDIDHEGKDTWRHKQAGAETVVISSPWKISVIRDVVEEAGLDRIVAEQLSDMDIVLTEGYKNAGMPQVEVFLSTAHRRPLHGKENPGTLVAVMSDVPLDIGVPRLHIDDVPALADLIEARFLSPPPGR